MTRDSKAVKHSDRDEQDIRRKPSQQQSGQQDRQQGQQGDQSRRGLPDRQQQQQHDPASQPAPGGGEPEVQEDLPDRERVGDRGSRNPQVDVERP